MPKRHLLWMLQTTWPYHNRTVAHISYAYDVYTGTTDSYLQVRCRAFMVHSAASDA